MLHLIQCGGMLFHLASSRTGKLEHDAVLIARAQQIARDAGAPPPAGPARSELLAAIQAEPTN